MRHAPQSVFTTATPVHYPDAVPATWLRAALAGFIRVMGLPGRIVAARRDMALLGRMSAGELADIGLARQDLWDAAALPFGHAPGRLLARRAAERRQAAIRHRR